MFWIQSDFVSLHIQTVDFRLLTSIADKKDNAAAKIPEFSQVGTIIEGPTEYLSGRLTNKERKQTFVEEVLAREKSENKRQEGTFQEDEGDETWWKLKTMIYLG
jgi:hypothetical protein